ncbi:hypothetical protein BVC80_9037g55 [Macleaya cordata]|uniref:RNase H type-1 domain-containing protein n=1 Tax=Macleaya cordata TaxID=56857 RepID=A0A200Q5M6_MACCD|nr:hypothetical protein BVC80_9037g52 [Macleaya cordata]OVA05785.1 hypothetical protein BVC80_9037g55 [Macleaya cordata]
MSERGTLEPFVVIDFPKEIDLTKLDVSDVPSDESSDEEIMYKAEVDDYVTAEYVDEDDDDDGSSSTVEQRMEGESENLHQDKKYQQNKPPPRPDRYAPKVWYWFKPPYGEYRVDTDGSVSVFRKRDGSFKLKEGGYGAIVRDHNGKLISAAAGVSKPPVSVLYHKLEGIKKGIDLAIQYCDSCRVSVYCDSLVAVTLIDNIDREMYSPDEVDYAEVNDILDEISEAMSKVKKFNLCIRHTIKWVNVAADYLSKLFKQIEIVEPNVSGDEELKKLVSEKFGEGFEDIVSKDEKGIGYKCGV